MVVEQRRRAAARGANLMAERHLALYAELLSGATADPTRRPPSERERGVDLSDLAAAIWRRRWVVVAVVVCTTALAAGFALLRTESLRVLGRAGDHAEHGGDRRPALVERPQHPDGHVRPDGEVLGVRDRAAEALGRPLGAEIDTSVRSGTGILRITASATDPVVAADAAVRGRRRLRRVAGGERLDQRAVDDRTVAAGDVACQPPVGLVVALGAGLGLFGGVVLALVVDRARPRLVDATDIGTLGAPSSAAFPHQVPPPAPLRETEDDAMDAFRDVRTELTVRGGAGGQGPGGGRRRAGRRCVDAGRQPGRRVRPHRHRDRPRRRRPAPARQHVLFGLDNASGLSAALAGEEPKLQVTDGLEVAGPHRRTDPSAPTDSLHAGIEACIDGLRSAGALVVVDAPPMLDGNDARLVARSVDGVVMVAGYGAGVDGVRAALDQLATTGAELIGVVLSGDRSRR